MCYLDWTDAEVFALTRERRREHLLRLHMQEPQDVEAVARAYKRLHGVEMRQVADPIRFSGPSAEFKCQKITVVRGNSRRRKSSYKTWRVAQWVGGNRCCYYCRSQTVKTSKTLNNPFLMTVDHKQPLALDGEDQEHNWVVCCWQCNNDKGVLTEAEFRTVLAFRKAAA